MKLTLQQIKQIFGEATFDKGMDYYNRGMVHSTVIMHSGLKARCKGSMPYSYYVNITFNKIEDAFYPIKTARCSCPVGYGCKHIAAVLIDWHFNANSFRAIESVQVYLLKQKKEELVNILLKLAEKDNDVMEWLFKLKDKKQKRKKREKASICNCQL